MLTITPCRTRISDRFPVASFVVNVEPDRTFEVVCATDPRLFHPQNRSRRSSQNFATSRAQGLMRAPAGQVTYLLPPNTLQRFAGATRLYYAAGMYESDGASSALFTVDIDRPETIPCIQMAADFTGRTLDRGRLGARAPAQARYGGSEPVLTWGGDLAMRSLRWGAAQPAQSADTRVPYDDGFDAALWDETPPPRQNGARAGILQQDDSRHQARVDAESAGALVFLPVQGIENVSEAFKDRVYEIARDLDVDVNYLMSVMSFESAHTFSPSIRNAAGSGATGLIQFMPSTARSLGTTTDALAAMSAEEQLDYVARYFEPYRGRLTSIEDAYMAVLYPSAIGRGAGHVLFRQDDPSTARAYEQNRGLDGDGDGVITVGDATTPVRRILDSARARHEASATAQGFGRGLARHPAARNAVYGARGRHGAAYEPPGVEHAPDLAARALFGGATTPALHGITSEPPGVEHAPDLGAQPLLQKRSFGNPGLVSAAEPPGFEHAPDLSTRAPTHAHGSHVFGHRTAQHRAGSNPRRSRALAGTGAVAHYVAFPDMDDESLARTELDPAAQLTPPLGHLSAAERLAAIHRVAELYSGSNGYGATIADPRAGLRWGLLLFAQRHGGLGDVLGYCASRDRETFATTFAPFADELLAVTGADTAESRMQPVAGKALVEYADAFTRASQHRAFQEAQRECADKRYVLPNLHLCRWLGLDDARGLAMFLDRVVHMGNSAGARWIVDVMCPTRAPDQQAAALAALGHQHVSDLQRSVPELAVTGSWNAHTHAAALAALRALPGQPVAVPGVDQSLRALVDAARGRAEAGDPLWQFIAGNLETLMGAGQGMRAAS